jgi:hypothetical protein
LLAHRTDEFRIVTLAALKDRQPNEYPSYVVPAVMVPVNARRAMPAGTPVLDASGYPHAPGWAMQPVSGPLGGGDVGGGVVAGGVVAGGVVAGGVVAGGVVGPVVGLDDGLAGSWWHCIV